MTKMKKFIITTYEKEEWIREYTVKAKNEIQAEEKLWNGEWGDCINAECVTSKTDIENIKEVKK